MVIKCDSQYNGFGMKVREGSVNPLDALFWGGNDSLGVAPSAGSMSPKYPTVQGIMGGETTSGIRSDSPVDYLCSVTTH